MKLHYSEWKAELTVVSKEHSYIYKDVPYFIYKRVLFLWKKQEFGQIWQIVRRYSLK